MRGRGCKRAETWYEWGKDLDVHKQLTYIHVRVRRRWALGVRDNKNNKRASRRFTLRSPGSGIRTWSPLDG